MHNQATLPDLLRHVISALILVWILKSIILTLIVLFANVVVLSID